MVQAWAGGGGEDEGEDEEGEGFEESMEEDESESEQASGDLSLHDDDDEEDFARDGEDAGLRYKHKGSRSRPVKRIKEEKELVDTDVRPVKPVRRKPEGARAAVYAFNNAVKKVALLSTLGVNHIFFFSF